MGKGHFKRWRKNMGGGGRGGGGGSGEGGGGGRGRGRGGRKFVKNARFGEGGKRFKGQAHRENIFQSGCDLNKLQSKYPEFGKYTSVKDGGRLAFNFKSKACLHAMTKYRIRDLCNLDVNFADNYFVPNLHFRMELILKAKDILSCSPSRDTNVHGIELATDSSCVYPILTAWKNKSWNILATETDLQSCNVGMRNIKQNGLEDRVKLKRVGSETLLRDVPEGDIVYDFCFYQVPYFKKNDAVTGYANTSPFGSNEGRDKVSLPKTVAQLLHGGETDYVKKYVDESKLYKDRVRLFFVHAGRNSTVRSMEQQLLKLVGAKQMAVVPFFCGPQVTYAFIWTFFKDIPLSEIADKSGFKIGKTASRLQTRLKLTRNETTMNSCVERAKFLLEHLEISYTTERAESEEHSLKLTAKKMTWRVNVVGRPKNYGNDYYVKPAKRFKSEAYDSDDDGGGSSDGGVENSDDGTNEVPTDSGSTSGQNPLVIDIDLVFRPFPTRKDAVDITLENQRSAGVWNAAPQLILWLRNQWNAKNLPAHA